MPQQLLDPPDVRYASLAGKYVHEDQLTERRERFRNQGRIYADDPEGYGA